MSGWEVIPEDEQRICTIRDLICAIHRSLREDKPVDASFALETLSKMIPIASTLLISKWTPANWNCIYRRWDEPLEMARLGSAYAEQVQADDDAADAGWIIALGYEVMSLRQPPVLDWPSPGSMFGTLERLLGAKMSAGVAVTGIEHVRIWWMHECTSKFLVRGLCAQPDAVVRTVFVENTSRAFADSVEHSAAADPDGCRPPPALIEFHRVMSQPGTFDEKIDQLADSDGRESVAALVACCQDICLPADRLARIRRVLTAGNIRPADALAIVYASMMCPPVPTRQIPPEFLDEVAELLAVQFVTGDPRNHYRRCRTQLQIPPVIV
jgi:hypothetical protein